MEKIDSNEEPILYSEIEEKYSILLQTKTLFNSNIIEINQIIDNVNIEEPKNVSLIKMKFNEVKNQMNTISEGIICLNNLIPDEDIPMTIKLRDLADNVNKNFANISSRFQTIMINKQKNIDEQLQLSLYSDISSNDKSTDPNIKNDILLNKDKTKEIEKEYKQICVINNPIYQLNDEIKFDSINQDNQIEIINLNIDEIKDNNYKIEDSEDNINYYKYIRWIVICIIILAFLIYYKI